MGWACASGAFPRWGVGWGGGGGLCGGPPVCAAGGQWDWGSPCLGPSPCLPGGGNEAGVLHVALAIEGVAPIPFLFACCLRARPVWRPCAQARIRLSIAVPASAGGWGVEAGPAPASLPGAAVLPGGGEITGTASGGVGAGVPVACGLIGGVGASGRIAPWLSSSLSGGGWPAALCSSPLLPPAHPFPVHAFGQGLRAACRWRASLAGRGGGAVREPPLRGGGQGAGGRGGVLPWSVPLPSPGGQNCGRHRRRSGHGGAAPILLRFVRRPRAWPLRWSCALLRVRLPAATSAGAGSGGCGGTPRAGSAAAPSRVSRSFLAEGGRPLGRGGGRGSAPPWPASRGGAGGGAPLFPSLPPWGAACGPRPCPPPSTAHPPCLYRGCLAVIGAGRGPVGRRWVSAGGGERVPRYDLPPRLPQAGIKAGRLVRASPGAHRSVAAHGVGAEPPAGSGLCGNERAADRGRLMRGCVHRGCGVSPLGATAP